MRVLVVDDERKITEIVAERISSEGMDVEVSSSAEEALPVIERGNIDVLLCDLRLGGMDGIELLRRAKKIAPSMDVVVMTAYASAETAIEAMREGAYEYLVKPFQLDELAILLKRISERRDLISENEALKERLFARKPAERIVGTSAAIEKVREMIARVAPTDTPVLLLGESGTGKELAAAEIHSLSSRAKGPFIVLNCAAVPEQLLESELFGHERGAFTGAVLRKPGQFKLADGGTLFMDEIGEISPSVQSKLLRAIEAKEFLPLGSSRAIKVNVRIIAATNRDLDMLVKSGRFREDLYYRLNVFPIRIPPLRERPEDVIPIAEHFLKQWRGSEKGPISKPHLGASAKLKLSNYSWPGNVRELRNVLERATILCGNGPIEAEHIAIECEVQSADSRENLLRALLGEMSLPEIEKRLVELALEKASGNKSRAAEILGITRRAIYGRLKKFSLPLREDE